MVDKICDKLMDRVKIKMPEVDEERAEIIRYGFELMIGETPKIVLMIALAALLGKMKYFLISALVICIYRTFSGGIHLKTHIGCIFGTAFLYLGNVYISEALVFTNPIYRNVFYIGVFIFAIAMVSLYAPADTDAVPILRKKDRMKRKILSYLSIIATLISAFMINDYVISNLCVIGILLQTITITKFSYKIFKVKFGYFEYIKG